MRHFSKNVILVPKILVMVVVVVRFAVWSNFLDKFVPSIVKSAYVCMCRLGDDDEEDAKSRGDEPAATHTQTN